MLRLLHSLVVALLCVSALQACGEKKKSSSNEASSKAAPPAVEGLEAVPASARVVIGLDVPRLAEAQIVGRALERMFARDPSLKKELSEVLEVCKVDVKTDIKSVSIALVPGKEGSDSLLVAKGRLSEAAIASCLGRFMSESGGRLESSELEGRTLYHQKPKDNDLGVWLSFGSKDTVLVASSKAALVEALGKGPKLGHKGSGELAALMAKVPPKSMAWGVGLLEAPVAAGLVAATGGKVKPPRAIVGSADFSEGLDLAVDVLMESELDAKELISQAQMQLQAIALVVQSGAAGPLILQIHTEAKGPWAHLDWKLSEKDVSALLAASMSGLGGVGASPEVDAGPTAPDEQGIDTGAGNDKDPAPESGESNTRDPGAP